MAKRLLTFVSVLAGLLLFAAPVDAGWRSTDFMQSLDRLFDGLSEDFNRITQGSTRTDVDFPRRFKPGTIVVRTDERRLYFVYARGKAYRYAVGVGRQGYEWSGSSNISRKAEWPDWRPPAEMIARQPGLPHFVPGGPENPLGARALYLGDTLYRIHGTSESHTIGTAVSSGCIRMLNDDVIDLYGRARVGDTVHVFH